MLIGCYSSSWPFPFGVTKALTYCFIRGCGHSLIHTRAPTYTVTLHANMGGRCFMVVYGMHNEVRQHAWITPKLRSIEQQILLLIIFSHKQQL